MLEITSKDIGFLNGEDLRELVGLLCEAEMLQRGISTVGITWGGKQNSPDGGIDVRTNILLENFTNEYIPRQATCFQIKKSKMPPSSIKKEMSSTGILRESIKELAKESGAYIIVSGSDFLTDSDLKKRLTEMHDTVSGLEFYENLKLDFYDQGRLASWVRSHPSIVLWVRNKMGRPMQGWKPFDNWSNSPGGIDEEFLIDDRIRINYSNRIEMTAIEGINSIRKLLITPRSTLRLAGLSGVGKTRLLTALFDERIGARPLNRLQVYYTDLGDEPEPTPLQFLNQLISFKLPFILIIDNCPSDLHKKLASNFAALEILGSLITVEYDIREDLPEDTDVYKLEPVSVNLIEKLLSNRFVYINPVNIRNIAEFSGGNARMAIALAKTIDKDKIAELSDENLFERLFYQRNHRNSNLLKSAEVCSLVYSFDSRTAKQKNIELALLSKLANKSVNELFEDIAELKRRDLIQQRNIWKAVLPQAIANKLALRALESIPVEYLLEVFENGGSKRLLISFSRRLNYLHESEIAFAIVKKWFSPNGFFYPLNSLSRLNSLKLEILINIAPIAPSLTLEAIEEMASEKLEYNYLSTLPYRFYRLLDLLKSIAYDSELFERCAYLLYRFTLIEDDHFGEGGNASTFLDSLFYLEYSGTHAHPIQKLNFIKRLFSTNDFGDHYIGNSLLSRALMTGNSANLHSHFGFGARVRDYGYSPKNRDDVEFWYKLFLDFAILIAKSTLLISEKVKKTLACRFEDLWNEGLIGEEMEFEIIKISNILFWSDIWISVYSMLGKSRNEIPTESFTRLLKLEISLRPVNLADQIQIFLPSDKRLFLNVNEKKFFDQQAETIGRLASAEERILKQFLSRLSTRNDFELYHFGIGVANGCLNPIVTWKLLCKWFAIRKRAKFEVLCGFLHCLSKNNLPLVNSILDEFLSTKWSYDIYPFLQFAISLDENGVKRLKAFLDTGNVRPESLLGLKEKIGDPISNINAISDLILKISDLQKGLAVAIDIYTSLMKNEQLNADPQLRMIGEILLVKIKFEDKHEFDKCAFTTIVEYSLSGKNAQEIADMLCKRIFMALLKRKFHTNIAIEL